MSAIKKALEVLDLYLYQQKVIGVTEAARMAGLDAATTYRIVNALTHSGYLEQTSKRGKYFISKKKILGFTDIVMPDINLRNMAWPFLQDLSTRLQEGSQIALRLGNVAYKDDFLNTVHSLIVHSTGVKIIDLYSTATGKALLAHMNEREMQEYFTHTVIKQLTPNTITDTEKLKSHLKTIRDKGIAIDREEHEMGMVGVAAPVFTGNNTATASIGVVVPAVRANKKRQAEIAEQVSETAAKISTVLQLQRQNHKPPDS